MGGAQDSQGGTQHDLAATFDTTSVNTVQMHWCRILSLWALLQLAIYCLHPFECFVVL